MCGIFGIIANNARVPAEVLDRVTESLAHRRLDDSGSIILHDSAREDVEVSFGNRRLAIFDLSPQGHQPIHDPATDDEVAAKLELLIGNPELRRKMGEAAAIHARQFDWDILTRQLEEAFVEVVARRRAP